MPNRLVEEAARERVPTDRAEGIASPLRMTRKHPGKVVSDRFEVERIAGSGGMGVVYQAHDRVSGHAVALKVLLERDQGPAERFAHEIELLSTLNHPHIVGYVSHGTTDEGSPYLVMPWLEGMDLQERLRSGPLSIAETLALARHVADALACLHARGLVHRDLKPSNLFLPDGTVGNVQLIDLGVARASVASHALTLSGVLIGTPGFIAPEQARGDREIAPAVDVFAFGCVLFECLTGRRLFTGSHLMSVLAKILLEDAPRVIELVPAVPPALDILVHRMVSKEPEKRPRDGAELVALLADLERAPSSVVGRASSPSTLTESERRVVTVLVVVLPPNRTPEGGEDDTRVEADPFHSLSARFGVRAHLLAERMAIVLAPERASAGDQAAVLARFARHAVQAFRGARIALTTGSAVTGARLPVGEAIERAVTMVRTVERSLGVQIDEVTAALITSRFEIRREAGMLVVDDERFSLDPARPLLGKPTSCVGRERELALLEATVAECADGEGPKVVLLTAAAGTGKSRLRHELIRRLSGQSGAPRVLQCRGDPLHMATPYALIAQTVRQAADLREMERPEIVREKLSAHVAALLPESSATRVKNFLGEMIDAQFEDQEDVPLRAARHDAVAMTDQIAHAFEDILRAWCEKQSLVLLLEDLHWADVASIKLLDRALRKLAGADLFVLALARPEIHERFPTLFQNRDITELHLPPIPKRACARLVHEVMGERAKAADVGRIVERSEGNGFYLEELIRAEVENPRGAGASSPSSPPAGLPETVIAVAQARLERLEPHVRKVLRAASIFGDVFWLEGVSALVGEEPAALRPILASLVDEEAIFPSEQPRLAGVYELSFRHALLRATAYATLTDEDRALGHRLAAEWLEGLKEDGEVVALHWLEGGGRARAASSFLRAGKERWARAQAEAAARCATRALLVGAGEREDAGAIAPRVHLLATALEAGRTLDAGETLAGLERHVAFDAGAPGASRALVHAAIERALRGLREADPRRALPLLLADAACAIGALSDFEGAKRLLAEAAGLSANEEAKHPAVLYASAKVAFWAGEAGVALELLGDALLPEDPQLRLQILLILAWSVVMVGGKSALGRGLDFVSRAEAILESKGEGESGHESPRGDPAALVHCAKARGACFHFASEYTLGVEAEAAVVALARRTGLRFDESAHLHNAAEIYLRLGDRERARAAITESYAIARDIGAERSQRHNEMLLAYLDGRADRLVQLAEGATAASDRWLELYTRYWLGRLLAASGAPGARRALDHAFEIAVHLKFRIVAEDCTRALAALPPEVDGGTNHAPAAPAASAESLASR
jgi:eukaryotic-like serine/threonine-protein kinase